MKIGRNEICHCGSGKKFKQCHQSKKNNQSAQLVYLAFISFAIITIFFIGNTIFTSANTTSNLSPKTFSIENAQPIKRPKGDAPPGKIWSVEHGHWHNKNNKNTH